MKRIALLSSTDNRRSLGCAPDGRALPYGSAGSGTSGMVWEKHGDWHLNGSSDALRLGEAIPPGGLLTAGAETSAHSIVILLPDGQRMLCECYEAKTCSQGFPPVRRSLRSRSPPSGICLLQSGTFCTAQASAETAFPIPAAREEMAVNSEIVAAVSPQDPRSLPRSGFSPQANPGLGIPRWANSAAAAAPSVQPLDWSAAQGGASSSRRSGPLRLERVGSSRRSAIRD